MNMVFEATTDGEILPLGTSLMQGYFTITGTLHKGGFGIAYLAQDQTGKAVVIKECFPEVYCRRIGRMVSPAAGHHRADFQAIQRQFQSEARIIASFDHPNIVGIQNIFDENGTSYMVLDHIEGRDLQDILTSSDTLDPDQIIEILGEALKALAYVHEQGYIHGDISPDNIIITPEFKPILIDFGTARKVVPDDVLALPVIRAVKDGYSPQEFYIAGGKVGLYSDLYALAASFYTLITGECPVGAQDRIKAISRQRPDPYQPLSTLTSIYPHDFCTMMDQALAAFPRKRPQAAEDWLDVIITERPHDDRIPGPHAHTHSPKGTGIYRSPAE